MRFASLGTLRFVRCSQSERRETQRLIIKLSRVLYHITFFRSSLGMGVETLQKTRVRQCISVYILRSGCCSWLNSIVSANNL